MDQTIGEVARRAGVTERTLRYDEELGLLTPRRDDGGHRRYDADHVDRLYRIRLLRALGTPVAGVDPERADRRRADGNAVRRAGVRCARHRGRTLVVHAAAARDRRTRRGNQHE